MSQVDIDVAAKDLRSLVERARAGEEVVLVDGGREVAKLVRSAEPAGERPPSRQLDLSRDRWRVAGTPDEALPADLFQPSGQPLRLGLLAGRATVPPNFDAPLPDDVLDLFEGR